MKKTLVSTSQAPAAIGPYSQGAVFGSLVFTAGQLPIHPVTGEVSEDISEQTRQCMENLGAILKAAGTGFDKVIKATIFITDFADFGAVNEVYASFFSGDYPARSTVGISGLAKGARVEIEMIAHV